MKFPVSINKKGHILLSSLFLLIWLINLTGAGGWYPAYLAWGLFSLLCLWDSPKKKSPAWLYPAGACLSLASILIHLSLFDPVTSLLSIVNMAMSLIGGTFSSVAVLQWLFSSEKEDLTRCPRTLVEVLFIFLWLTLLRGTDSRYAVYLFCGVAGTLCACDHRDSCSSKRADPWIFLFAVLFSLAAVLANYPLFTPLLRFPSLLSCLCCLAGGFFAGYRVLSAMMARLPMEGSSAPAVHPRRVFFLTAPCFFLIGIGYLFSSCYPGLMTRDSISTVEQVMGIQEYNNTMPYWHTVTVQPFLLLGANLFGTVDAGIALFHCVQVLLMAVCFGAVLVTLYQIGVPAPVLLLVAFFYLCIPYNIVYSVTLWKDVPFSGAAVLFVTGLYRLIKGVGKSQKLNYLLLIIGAIGFSLWRTNGWYAFLATFIIMALITGKKHWKLLIIMALVLVLCWALINPVLDALGVSETNLVEAFAVPMQQVARVVACQRPLSEEETQMLSNIFWLDMVQELYNPLSVDPIKFETFRNENIHLITEDPLAYLRLYLSLGIQYPADYLKAWIDETKGFWNGGYEYWIYDLGQTRDIQNTLDALYTSAFRFLNDTEAMKLFSSVGLFVWGMIGCCLVNCLKKREELLLSIPALVLIAGLWLGTPVFCEFRYAYPLMLTLPFVACVTLYKKRDTL